MNFYHNDIWQITLIILILTGVILGYFEFRSNSGTKRRITRITALVAGLVSVFCLITKPNFENTETGSKAIVITPGTTTAQLNELEKLKHNIFRTDKSMYDLPDPSRYDSILLLGNGLKGSSAAILKDKYVTWEKPMAIRGISQIRFPEVSWKNRAVEISGKVSDSNLFLISSINSITDTLLIDNHLFKFNHTFKKSGRNLIELWAIDSSGTVHDYYPIGMDTRTATPMRFLVLSSFPKFEYRFIREHLAAEGHQVTSRTMVSRNTFTWEFLNSAAVRSDPFRRLDVFDMLIMDEDTFNKLSGNERKLLLNAIDNGLGLLMIDPVNALSSDQFLDQKLPPFERVKRTVIDMGSQRLNILPFAFLNESENTDWQATLTHGGGQISFSLLSETYPLLLSGDSVSYRAIWSDLIFKTARTKETARIDLMDDSERHVDERMTVSVYSRSRPSLSIDNFKVALEQDRIIREKWLGYYWPADSGWHTANLITGNDSIKREFHVPGNKSWQTFRQRSSWNHTQFMMSADAGIQKEMQPPRSLSPTWWLLLFLLSFGYLWLEPRI